MSFNVKVTGRFEKELKRLLKKFPSLKSEYLILIETLEAEPQTGVPLGNNCFKIRISIQSKGKGKSGGGRVITHFYVEKETVYLLSIYDKSERSSLSQVIIKQILKSLL
ncbi:MAG TPA: hypothetical protein VLA71_17310 [Algoriphagus sp.]|nr:hypothetical protein [Algoriphagus sp.]